MNRIIRDIMCILLILIMPMWLMELLEIEWKIDNPEADKEIEG
jgi:hypothetical protein